MNKKGIILIIYFYIAIILIFCFLFIILFQFNVQILGIKKDLFYILQNCFLALNKEEIAYNNIKVNEYVLKNEIEKLLKLNYPKYNLKIENLIYKDQYVYIDVKYRFIPVNTLFLKEKDILIKEKVKLKEITYE